MLCDQLSEIDDASFQSERCRGLADGASVGTRGRCSVRHEVCEVLKLANKSKVSKKSKMAKMRAHFLINAEEPHAKALRRQGRSSGYVAT